MASERWKESAAPRRLVVVGVPSALGIRPYDDGTIRHVEDGPATLRQLGLVAALGARDAGDITPEPYRDFEKPAARARNDAEVGRLSEALAARIATVRAVGEFPVVVAGECSVVVGALAGLHRSGVTRPGLAYIDGHADFATPAESRSGSVASMCLGLAVGRAPGALASFALDPPLVGAADVAIIGRRDQAEPWYGHDALHASPVLDLPDERVRGEGGYRAASDQVLSVVGGAGIDGFWIHVDADVLPADVMAAVDSPADGGPTLEELTALVRALARHPKACGLALTIYDPALDEGLRCGRRLVHLLTDALVERDVPAAAEQSTRPAH